jgi:hypothetical protein
MKTCLLCLALLLTASVAMAHGLKEPDYNETPCWVSPPGGDLWYPCDSNGAKQAACLNLMEQAMRAVDPYVPSVEMLKALPILQEDRATAGRILKQWDRAKNECWPELRDRQPQHYH